MVQGSSKATGDAAEHRALAFLQKQGLRLLERNYRVARGPFARGAEIDLIMQDDQSTLIFVEVRARHQRTQGGAAASITLTKQRRIVRAAQYYLMQWNELPACRFDVVVIEGNEMKWLQAAFEAVV